MYQRRSRKFRRRSNGRNYQSRGNGSMQGRLRSQLFSNDQPRNNFRTIQNPEKLFEKYSALAKEALSAGDKTLSENYLQHADHFSRIIIYQESLKVQNSDIIQSENKDLIDRSEKDTSENEKNTDKSNIID